MPTFETPPDWWISLANLTDWFDWTALGAIGTVGALWYAVVQGFRASRFERMRAASTLTRVLELVGPIVESMAVNDDGDVIAEELRQTWRDGQISRAIEGVKTVSFESVPDTIAHSYLEILRMTLPALEAEVADNLFGIFSLDSEMHCRPVEEAYAYMHLLRRVYRDNSWQARRELKRRFLTDHG